MSHVVSEELLSFLISTGVRWSNETSVGRTSGDVVCHENVFTQCSFKGANDESSPFINEASCPIDFSLSNMSNPVSFDCHICCCINSETNRLCDKEAVVLYVNVGGLVD
jgi:hypothetical protein